MTRRQRLTRLATHLLVGAVGVVLGGFILFVIQVRGGPPLQPWHTAEFDSEFTAADTGRIADLDAYRALEQRLFQEVDRRVYDLTPRGPEFRLARFSPGSLPDPRGRDPDWNRTYVLEAPEARGSVLMLHGLSDSPYSLRALGQALNTRGYRVVGLRLPGHGTAPSGLLAATWEDMAAAAALALETLRAERPGEPVHLVGYSTGAALALHLSLEALDRGAAPPASLVLVSPAIGVTPLAALARWNRRLSVLPGVDPLAWQSNLPEFDPYKYGSFPFNAADQVYRLTRTVQDEVERHGRDGSLVDMPPVLAFLSAVDATVSADAVIDNLLGHLPPGRSELVLFDVNRNSAGSTVLRNDPGPLTARLLGSSNLPFDLTLITNASPETNRVVTRRRRAHGTAPVTDSLGLEWPPGVISLSHVALPFPPDDPLYGDVPPPDGQLYLGRLMVQGERGLLLFPPDWLVRIRHNPFFDYLEVRTRRWIDHAGPSGAGTGPR